MAVSEADVIAAVRSELGDEAVPFRDSLRGTGTQDEYNLSARSVTATTFTIFEVFNDGSVETVDPAAYTLDAVNGIVTFDEAPDEDAILIAEGESYGLFSDATLTGYVDAAVGQHLLGRVVQRRYRDGHGFIKYDREPMALANMPAEEKILVNILATVEALWALSTDASMDIDVQTAEGTSIPRGQRWRQLISQIDLLTDKYKTLSMAMGVGLYAPEVFDMRRVSRTTGRLVPVFQEREYDEIGPPIRKLPKPQVRDSDPDGPQSPWFSGGWGF